MAVSAMRKHASNKALLTEACAAVGDICLAGGSCCIQAACDALADDAVKDAAALGNDDQQLQSEARRALSILHDADKEASPSSCRV